MNPLQNHWIVQSNESPDPEIAGTNFQKIDCCTSKNLGVEWVLGATKRVFPLINIFWNSDHSILPEIPTQYFETRIIARDSQSNRLKYQAEDTENNDLVYWSFL